MCFACLYKRMIPGAQGSQKRAADPWTEMIRREQPCGCWEMNPGPLQEQVLLTLTHLSSPLLKKHNEVGCSGLSL